MEIEGKYYSLTYYYGMITSPLVVFELDFFFKWNSLNVTRCWVINTAVSALNLLDMD